MRFRTTWTKWENTVIEGDFLASREKTNLFSRGIYDPFHYLEDIPKDIISEFYPSKRKACKVNLPYLFAAIKTPEQALLWVKHFGYPSAYYPEGYQKNKAGKYSLTKMMNEVEYINTIIKICIAAQNNDINLLSLLCKKMKEFDSFAHFRDKQEAIKYINDVITKHSKTITPTFSTVTDYDIAKATGRSPLIEENAFFRLEWKIEKLFSTMLFMIGYHLSSMGPPIKCSNETCEVFFVPTNKRNMFCSESCRNAQQQRKQRTTPIGKIRSLINNCKSTGKITSSEAKYLNKLILELKNDGIDADIIHTEIKKKLRFMEGE